MATTIENRIRKLEIFQREINENLLENGRYTHPNFQSLDNRLGKVETRLVTVETRLVTVETRLVTVETRLVTVETKLVTVETRLGTVETRLGKVEAGLVKVEAGVESNRELIKGLRYSINILVAITTTLGLASISGIVAILILFAR